MSDPKRFGREEVYVEDAHLADDGRTVTLVLEEMARKIDNAFLYNIDELKKQVRISSSSSLPIFIRPSPNLPIGLLPLLTSSM